MSRLTRARKSPLASGAAEDEDLVRIHLPSGRLSLELDGSAHGIPGAVDLDAVDVLIDGSLLFSFDRAGSAAGIPFFDEDVLLFDRATQTFELVYDGSARHSAWIAADLDAVDGSLDPDADGLSDAADPCPLHA